MPLVSRLRRSLTKRWHQLTPTPKLIQALRAESNRDVAQGLLEALRERLAYQDGTLEAVDWSGAQLNAALLSSCRLSNANFSLASLRGAYLGYSDLRRVNFAGADLSEAHLREANLENALLTGSSLRGANLARANLTNARLIDVDFSRANLWETNLCGADLTGARLFESNLRNVKTDKSTILPDGAACASAESLMQFVARVGLAPD